MDIQTLNYKAEQLCLAEAQIVLEEKQELIALQAQLKRKLKLRLYKHLVGVLPLYNPLRNIESKYQK